MKTSLALVFDKCIHGFCNFIFIPAYVILDITFPLENSDVTIARPDLFLLETLENPQNQTLTFEFTFAHAYMTYRKLFAQPVCKMLFYNKNSSTHCTKAILRREKGIERPLTTEGIDCDEEEENQCTIALIVGCKLQGLLAMHDTFSEISSIWKALKFIFKIASESARRKCWTLHYHSFHLQTDENLHFKKWDNGTARNAMIRTPETPF